MKQEEIQQLAWRLRDTANASIIGEDYEFDGSTFQETAESIITSALSPLPPMQQRELYSLTDEEKSLISKMYGGERIIISKDGFLQIVKQNNCCSKWFNVSQTHEWPVRLVDYLRSIGINIPNAYPVNPVPAKEVDFSPLTEEQIDYLTTENIRLRHSAKQQDIELCFTNYRNGLIHGFQQAIDNMIEVPVPVDNWIRVEDGLPDFVIQVNEIIECSEDYLVIDKVNGRKVASCIRYKVDTIDPLFPERKKGYVLWETGNYNLYNVTHWQPLPTAPKQPNK